MPTSPTIHRNPLATAIATLGLGLMGLSLAWTGSDIADVVPDSQSAGAGLRGQRKGSDSIAGGPCAFSPGTRMAYDVLTRARNRIDTSPLMEGVQVSGAALEARSTVLDRRAERRWHVELEAITRATDGSTVLAAHVETDGTRIDEIVQPPRPGLDETFLVRLDPRCSIREFGWRTQEDRDAVIDQQRLLSGLSWLAPRDDEPSYAGTLLGTVGRYHAGFTVHDDVVRGHLVEVDEPFGAIEGAAAPRFDVLASSIEVEPEPDRWFAALTTHRRLRLRMHGIEVGELEGSVMARQGDLGSWRPDVSLDDGGWSWGLLLGSRRADDAAGDAAPSALAGQSVTQVIERYLAMLGEGQGAARSARLLAQWLRANPEGADELVAQLRAGAFEGTNSASNGLFLALGTANTSQAMAALIGIVSGSDDLPGHRVSAALALSHVEAPTIAMIDAIGAQAERRDLDPTTRGSLAMSLGAFANRHAQRAPELAAEATSRIEDWLADPADDRAARDSLLAAGNTGIDALVPAIEPYLEHEDPGVRQRASYAMRHMSPQQAYPRLAARFDDDDSTVRASAIETMTRVSRAHAVAPPEHSVDVAIELLEFVTPQREHKALLALLGEAARRGNEGAQAVLEQQLDDELHSVAPNPQKLRALGQHANTRWTAP